MNLPRAALAATALLLVAGCGASHGLATTDSAAPAVAAPGGPAPVSVDGDVPEASTSFRSTEDSAGSGASGSKAQTAPDDPAQTAAVISHGQVSVEAEDVDKARFELRKLLDRWNGSISNEESEADDKGRTRHERLELRVPSTQFDTAMDALSRLGTLVDRSRSSEDVSTQVIDNRARVRSQRLSLARVQALLARAKSISEVIAIEAQLSERQADLDSLVQQQSYLADQTAMATISLYLSMPGKTVKDDPEDDDSGFLSGLRAGWDNLGDGTGAVLTAVGAALPFAGLAALVAFPLWLLRRRRTSRA